MKFKLLSLALLAALALPFHAHADLDGAPFIPEVDQRFDAIEDVLGNNDANDQGGQMLRRYARAVYDVAVDGGESIEHELDAALPAGALITAVYLYVDTKFADSGTGSLRFGCYTDGDLIGFTDFTALSINAVLAGGGAKASSTTVIVPSPAAAQSGYVSVPEACTIRAEVRSDSGYVPLTGGKSTLIVEYFIK